MVEQPRSTSRKLASAAVALFVLGSLPLNGQVLPASARSIDVVYAPNGSLFVLGQLAGRDLPPAVVQPNPIGGCDAGADPVQFLAKIAPGGDRLVWATYLCASVRAMAPDPDGNLYLAGNIRGPGVYIARLSSGGQSLLAVTSFAAPSDNPYRFLGLKLDASGNVYLAGDDASADAPVTRPRLSIPRSLNSYCGSGVSDQFVAKFDPSLGKLLFSIRIGSNYPTRISSFAVSPDGGSYLAASGGMGRNSLCNTWIALARLSPDGNPVYGVTQTDYSYSPYALAVGPSGTAYLGVSLSPPPISGPPGATIWKFDPQGTRVATGNTGGAVYGMRVDTGGNLDVIGYAWPLSLHITPGGPPACVPSNRLTQDNATYVARLDGETLQRLYTGFLPGWDRAHFAGLDRILVTRTSSESYSLSPLAANLTPVSISSMPIGPPPAGTIACVVNAASQDPASVAPGEIITIHGSGIGPAEELGARLDANGQIATELGEVSVLLGGMAAPLLYAGSHQINAVAPFGSVPGAIARLEIRRGGAPIGTIETKVTRQHPALFKSDSELRHLAALNQDGSLNSSTNRAPRGSVVSVFATGLGAMTPPAVDGSRPPQPAGRPVLIPDITSDLQPAQVEYLGNAPGLIQGLVQINIRVPPAPNSTTGWLGVAVSCLDGSDTGFVWVR